MCLTTNTLPTNSLDGNSDVFLAPVRHLDTETPTDSFNIIDEGGQYHFGFSHAGQVRSEQRDKDGNVHGYFSYFRHTGPPTIVFYSADKSGVRVSSNDLPVGYATKKSSAA